MKDDILKDKLSWNFVNSEISYQLKQKGFNEPCFGYYFIPDCSVKFNSFNIDNNPYALNSLFPSDNEQEIVCSAPMFQQVVEWFAKTYNIGICFKSITSGDKKNTLYYGIISGLNQNGIYKNSSTSPDYIPETRTLNHISIGGAYTMAFRKALALLPYMPVLT